MKHYIDNCPYQEKAEKWDEWNRINYTSELMEENKQLKEDVTNAEDMYLLCFKEYNKLKEILDSQEKE